MDDPTIQAFILAYLAGRPPAEQIDLLNDLAAELQVRADELRDEMRRRPADAS